MTAQSPDRSVKCYKCGMTFVSDGAMAMHHPCSFAPPGSAQSALDAVRATLEACPCDYDTERDMVLVKDMQPTPCDCSPCTARAARRAATETK